MEKVILGMLLSIALIAQAPNPSQVFTVSIPTSSIIKTTELPPSSQLFSESHEILASITSFKDHKFFVKL